MDNVGLEPTTFCVQNRRSPSELIAHILVLNVGIEPTACWLQVSCSSQSELIQHIGVPSGTWTHTVSRQFLRLVRLPFRHKHNKFGIPSWTRTKTNGFGDRRANQLQLRIYNNIGVPNRIWTYDPWIKSPMLFLLSYGYIFGFPRWTRTITTSAKNWCATSCTIGKSSLVLNRGWELKI